MTRFTYVHTTYYIIATPLLRIIQQLLYYLKFVHKTITMANTTNYYKESLDYKHKSTLTVKNLREDVLKAGCE